MTSLFDDPIFSLANGQIIISTRRWRVCRGLLSIAFDRARHSASNGLNIVDFGPSSSFSRTGDGSFASDVRTLRAYSMNTVIIMMVGTVVQLVSIIASLLQSHFVRR